MVSWSNISTCSFVCVASHSKVTVSFHTWRSVQGLAFQVLVQGKEGLGFSFGLYSVGFTGRLKGVQGLGFRDQIASAVLHSAPRRIPLLGLRVYRVGFRVQGLGFRLHLWYHTRSSKLSLQVSLYICLSLYLQVSLYISSSSSTPARPHTNTNTHTHTRSQ